MFQNATKPNRACYMYHIGLFPDLLFHLEDRGDMLKGRDKFIFHVSPKRRLTFNGLHGVISQEIDSS
jgi:hypothetical protein